MLVKIKKKLLICLDPVVLVFFIMGERISTFMMNFLEDSLSI